MTPFKSGALTAALLCSFPLGLPPVAASAAGLQASRAPLVLARTICDDNGRCYETGDPDRRFNQDDGDGGGVRRRRDPDDAGADDAGPRRRDRRDYDQNDAGPPPRDFDRRPPPPRDFNRDRRDDDDQ